MATIITRAGKGSALTWQEGDANFTNLNNAKLENITNESIGSLSDVSLASPANGKVLTYSNGNLVLQTPTSGGISNVVEDTTPQLGGNLDVNGQSIVSTSNGNIVVNPDGTGFSVINRIRYTETPYDFGLLGGAGGAGPAFNPDPNNGPVQLVTVNGDFEWGPMVNAVAGQSVTAILYQNMNAVPNNTSGILWSNPDTGWDGSAFPTYHILTMFYDGTNYYASLAKNFNLV